MRSALGKGLDALISDQAPVAVAETPKSVSEISIDKIRGNPKQPRRSWSDAALKDLTDSIKLHGVIQPILVNLTPEGNYEIIAGERRWRAAKRAGLTTIPAVVKSGSENQRFQLALIENIQREDLNPMEQANGFSRLLSEFNMTQEQIAAALGKDRAVIANTLRLLTLSGVMQSSLIEGEISASHGRALAAIEDAAARETLFKRILAENLSVRSVEQAVREHKQVAVKGHVRGTAPAKAPEVKAIEEDLQRTLTRKVELQTLGADAKKGWLKLEFYSLDDLDHLINQLKRNA